MTHSSSALLPDGKTSAHLFACENREWRGILAKVRPKNISTVQKELTAILEQFGYNSAESEDTWVFAKGTYSSKTIEVIEAYLRRAKHIIGRPIMPSGPYFSFMGYDWVEKYKKEY